MIESGVGCDHRGVGGLRERAGRFSLLLGVLRARPSLATFPRSRADVTEFDGFSISHLPDMAREGVEVLNRVITALAERSLMQLYLRYLKCEAPTQWKALQGGDKDGLLPQIHVQGEPAKGEGGLL